MRSILIGSLKIMPQDESKPMSSRQRENTSVNNYPSQAWIVDKTAAVFRRLSLRRSVCRRDRTASEERRYAGQIQSGGRPLTPPEGEATRMKPNDNVTSSAEASRLNPAGPQFHGPTHPGPLTYIFSKPGPVCPSAQNALTCLLQVGG